MSRRLASSVTGIVVSLSLLSLPVPQATAAPVGRGFAPVSAIGSFEQQVLTLTNKARATKRKCGATTYKVAKPLKWNAKLAASAKSHSADMAKRNYFSHTTKGKSASKGSPWVRIKATGYQYRYAGENIAAGYSTAKAVVNAWIKSPGHCKNLMNKNFTQLGVGYVKLSSSYYKTYITQNFGRPK